jgi:hypothetical protein
MFLEQRLIPLFHRELLIYDTTVGNDIAPHQYIYIVGWLPQQANIGPGRRVVGVLRKTITQDLVVRFNNVTSNSVLAIITLPKTMNNTTDTVVVDISTVSLTDLDVVTADITASDGSKDANGVASITIEWSGSI